MFTTLRMRLLVGLAPLLAIVVALGVWAIVMFARLGGNIDVILRENYRSVLYAERMKEALERMDSALLFALGGEERQAREQFDEHRPGFEENLAAELDNLTLIAEGEPRMAADLQRTYREFVALSDRYFALGPERTEERRRLYFGRLLPTFLVLKGRADDILRINQENMEAMDRNARRAAAVSIRLMAVALLASVAVGTAVALGLGRSILGPIRAVTAGARAVGRGDYDQVVPVVSRDELGEQAEAFNAMARRIRELQAAGAARLLRAQRTAQATIDSFPDPVIVVDPAGAAERANPAACRMLGVSGCDGSAVSWAPPSAIREPLAAALRGEGDYLPSRFEQAVTLRDDGQERALLPRVLAIRDEHGEPLGAAVVLLDITRFRRIDQLKNDLVSTVSHELKTPLTSLQMAVHLLLEEVVGPLSPKQVELLLAARQDAERLLGMVNDLLDLTRIEQGRVRLDLRPTALKDLLADAVARFEARARDAGIALEWSLAPGLPGVPVDRERVAHVFDNLVGNALEHTPRGGSVRLRAEADGDAVRFAVADTGAGIPAEHLPHLFEKFYRVPGGRTGGAGLGLAITREIVAAHGGAIRAESTPGRGTTFTFTLPTDPARADRPTDEEATP
ncbi:ATP-binding protein [Tautonia plasticadhaerens]|uniref:histidine kinase n=1 Tax=Tautonia plasticadhaerens TaxID=2527974 RepID=A0A518HEB4_9BACT|nr:ATP-binding protein [Tautonia plasticadhaerens]QDV39185.1 Alginate biosynthesis sensor protein KinB [Tautonia plasticadhaerens]